MQTMSPLSSRLSELRYFVCQGQQNLSISKYSNLKICAVSDILPKNLHVNSISKYVRFIYINREPFFIFRRVETASPLLCAVSNTHYQIGIIPTREAKFYRTSKIGKNMIPSSISSSFRVQINRKLNSHQFCPLNFLNPTYGSKVIKFQKDGKGCIRIQMLYTFKKVCSIIQRCCKEFLSCLTIIFLKFYFTPALKYIITNISRSQ